MNQEPERVTLLSSSGEGGNLVVKDCAPADEIGRLCPFADLRIRD